MPPRCCTEDLIPFKYVDKIFNQRFQRQWEQGYQGYLERVKYPYDVDEQLPLDRIKYVVTDFAWMDRYTVTNYYRHVFVVSPHETYLSAFGINVSLVLCAFRCWFAIIQKCLSEPRISKWQQASWVPPTVLQGIEKLRYLEFDGVNISRTIKDEASDSVDRVLVHWKILNILVQHPSSEQHRREIWVILDRIGHWIAESKGACPDIIASVQQWIYMVERTEAIWDPEGPVNCTPRYMFRTGKRLPEKHPLPKLDNGFRSRTGSEPVQCADRASNIRRSRILSTRLHRNGKSCLEEG